MGKYQRTKGHNWERAVAKKLQRIWPHARRGFQTRGGTEEAPDVDGTPFWVECKVGARPNIRAALKQASDADSGKPVMAITKRDRETPVVSLYLDDFLDYIHKLVYHNDTRGDT